MNKKSEFKKIAVLAANMASSKKAEEIVVYELGEESVTDYVVIMTADSHPQMNAIEDAITSGLKREGFYIVNRDGLKSKNWKIVDYGGIIIHVFESEAREFYTLDKIYHDAKKIKWEKAPPKKPAVKKKTVKKPLVKKTVAKKPAVKKKAVKKPLVKKTVAKKPAVKKKAVKKPLAKKTIAKKSLVKKKTANKKK